MINFISQLDEFRNEIARKMDYEKERKKNSALEKVYAMILENFIDVYRMSQRDMAIKSQVSKSIVNQIFQFHISIHDLRMFSRMSFLLAVERG